MKRLPLKIAFFLSGISGLVSALVMFFMKSEESIGAFMNLSVSRLALIGLTMIVSMVFFSLFFTWERKPYRVLKFLDRIIEKHKSIWIFVFFWVFVVLFILQQETLFIYLMQPIKMIDTEMFYLRIAPSLVWLSLTCVYLSIGILMSNLESFEEAQPQRQPTFIVFLLLLVRTFDSRRKTNFKKDASNLVKQHKSGLLVWLIALLFWIFIWLTGIGLVPDDRFWNIAGVPFLPMQVIGVVLLVFFLLDIRGLLPDKKTGRFSAAGGVLTAAVIIWTLSVVTWQNEPLYHTYFSPGPYFPNEVHYPFSDAMRFDMGSQYLIMGRGIANNGFTERPFLYVFLGLLHLLAGQDYDQVMFTQILFFGLIPVFMFLIGRQLHSSIAGIAISVLGIFYGKNAIAAANTAGIINPKVMMSELPTALLLVILAFCVIKWFQENRAVWAILAGGAIGLAIGVRGNALVVVPFLYAAVILHYILHKYSSKELLSKLALFTLALVLVLTPYSIKTLNSHGQVFFLPKIRTVIERASNAQTEAGPAKLQKAAFNHQSGGIAVLEDDFLKPATTVDSLQLPEELINYTARHFIHNQVTAVLIFPLDYKTLSLDEITSKPFWDGEDLWEGTLTPGEILLLSANLLIISLGIGYAIKTWQVAGTVPLVIHLSYQLANGLARTSGGRYLAPTNWVLTLYFCLGFIALIYSLRQFSGNKPGDHSPQPKSRGPGSIVLSLTLILGLGASFLFFEPITPKYPLVSRERAVQMLQEVDWSHYDIPAEMVAQFQDFILEEDAAVYMGLALYPRYYQSGEQNPVSSYLPRMETETSRIYFMLLTRRDPVTVNLIWGDQKLKTFPHAEYGLLLGRPKDGYIEGYAFIPISTADRDVYYAEPSLWE